MKCKKTLGVMSNSQ